MKNPSVSETAFDCPHCKAFTTQVWHSCYGAALDETQRVPFFPKSDWKEMVKESVKKDDQRRDMMQWYDSMESGHIFRSEKYDNHHAVTLNNLHVSRCYNCKKFSIWVNRKQVYPGSTFAFTPNPDLPSDVVALLEEARSIVDNSPKGAAALIRLGLQKLCKFLGERGDNINDDIGSLVKKGMDPNIQKALDVVRVVGNSAVHPGEINLDDDATLAHKLFALINVIAHQMITQPKEILELYSALPPSTVAAIAKRDTPKPASAPPKGA